MRFVPRIGNEPQRESLDLTCVLEDTGLNRMLGGSGNDQLYAGTGVDFMYGDGGTDVLYNTYGERLDAEVDAVADDAWKEYAQQSDKVWYYRGTNADDVISVDFVTEPGLLADHHLITRLTNNDGNYTFDAQIRLDFQARGEDGELIWDPSEVLFNLDALNIQDPTDRETALTSASLPRDATQ